MHPVNNKKMLREHYKQLYTNKFQQIKQNKCLEEHCLPKLTE